MSKTNGRSVEAGLSPELELLLCCARIKLDEEARVRAASLVERVEDWEYLLRAALRQRVMPLLYHHLTKTFPRAAPAEFVNRLGDHFYLSAARNHLLTDELAEILRLFNAEGIEAVPFKGPALALEIYGDVAQRQFSDLDILVRSTDVAAATTLLSRAGYRAAHELSPAQETLFLKTECERLFSHARRPALVDLHWDFVPRYFALRLKTDSFWERLRVVPYGNSRALAFPPEDLLLILSVHAAKEFWSCLVWLTDLSELIGAKSDLDWDALRIRAEDAGARRILRLSLALARELLGATLPREVIRDLETDRNLGRLAMEVKRVLFNDEVETKGVAQFLKPASALDRLADRARFHLRLATTPSPEDWTSIKLPARLSFLYHLTRPIRLAKKYLSRQ